MTSAPLTLYTFAMSHFSEKIRWTLDACQLPYQERCLTPVFHMPTALRLGRRGQTTLPIVQQGSVAVQDSPRIVDWLETRQGALSILPETQREAIRQIEQRFDSIGKDVARLLYAGSFGVADGHIRQLWTAHANPLQALVVTTDQGRGVVGVVDGFPTVGVEQDSDVQARQQFIRRIGYKC